MNRRKFLAFLAAGGVVTAEGLWMPGQKLISIPKRKFFNIQWLDHPAKFGTPINPQWFIDYGGSNSRTVAVLAAVDELGVIHVIDTLEVLNTPSQNIVHDRGIARIPRRIPRPLSLHRT